VSSDDAKVILKRLAEADLMDSLLSVNHKEIHLLKISNSILLNQVQTIEDSNTLYSDRLTDKEIEVSNLTHRNKKIKDKLKLSRKINLGLFTIIGLSLGLIIIT
jgi:hypothetical protein